ncbi:MAG: hypothetical protein INR68_09000 [Methylobacterium mesophilicum]|nr:hypothetical protein [Methylobacterium mesophilicum]
MRVDFPAEPIDLLLYTIGYEARSSHIASAIHAEKRIAVVYEHDQVLAFERNLEAAKLRGDQLITQSDAMLAGGLLLHTLRSCEPGAKIGVDVSSMDRTLMASILIQATDVMQQQELELQILYSPSSYLPPARQPARFMDFAPIVGLDGWTAHPERPLTMILGIGYEQDHALGALEYLDPSFAWVFAPHGFDSRFDADIRKGNRDLYELVPTERRIEYWIKNPNRLYEDLRSLTISSRRTDRIVIVPGGPKIFSALSILIKLEAGSEVAVWRNSGHRDTPSREVEAFGEIVRYKYPTFRSVTVDPSF